MSTIPPNWLASVLGTPGAQKHAGAAKNKEAAEQAAATDRTPFAEKLHNVIEQSDRDGEVYADAEGLGSQGRSTAEQQEQPPSDDEQQSGTAPGGLDVQA